MSSWVNEAAVPHQNGNGFPHINDPNVPVTGMIDPSTFMPNPSQFSQPATPHFATPQQVMAMQDGSIRNASPSFSNPVYQTNPVIPSKRPRPRDDVGASPPNQNITGLPTSRAETPQQTHFSAFPAATHPQQNVSQSFAHMPHNGSANATPSPIMANHIRAGSVPQRVSTTSPHPFSPASQNFPLQASPAPSDAGPAPQMNSYLQTNSFPAGFNANFNPTPSPAHQPPNASTVSGQMTPQHMPQHMGPLPMQGPMPSAGPMGQPGQSGSVNQAANQISPMNQMGSMGQMNPMGQMNQINQINQMGQIGQMGPMGQMGQMGQVGQMGPSQMFTPQIQQQIAHGRSALDQQKLMYQMQLQRQLQHGSMQQTQNAHQQLRTTPARQPSISNGQTPNASGGMKGPQSVPLPPQQNPLRLNPDQFLAQLSNFMSRQKLPLDMNPIAGDRPVNLVLLFQTVQKFGGYRHVSSSNSWPQVAHSLGIHPTHQTHPTHFAAAPAQLKMIYERNLLKFEEVWSRAKATQQQQGSHGMAAPQQQPLPPPQQQQQQQQQHARQVHQVQQTQQPPLQIQPPPQQLPQHQDILETDMMLATSKSGSGQHNQSQVQRVSEQAPPVTKQSPVNGNHTNGSAFSTPLQTSAHQQANSSRGQGRNGASRGSLGTPAHDDFTVESSSQNTIGGAVLPVKPTHRDNHANQSDGVFGLSGPPFVDSDEYKPCSRESNTFGGVDVDAPARVAADIVRLRPEVPMVTELGNIDIHAMTKSIQSRIHSEVRLALDTLATVTVSGLPGLDIDLDKCDDLLDSLIEYAEDRVEILAESTVEVSDEILIPPYEDISRACQIERLLVRDEFEADSIESELDKAVNSLLCITTILRNLSFNPHNQLCLADESTVGFLCQVIRYVGTRNMLLRTQLNTLDFMKDVIVLLSNMAGSVEISDREQAFCLLQFLLAFAPTPTPSLADDHIFFPTFQPATQPYLPPAVDALAKLLARDEPNRTHFRSVFAMDLTSTTPCDLLTRTFALAISPIPEHVRETRPRHLPPTVEVRKPILMQGLLAADIVATLAPGYESGVTRAWLTSGNGFAQNLHRSIRDLCRQFESVELHARTYRLREPPRKDEELMYIVVLAISLLRKLSAKAIGQDESVSTLPPNVLPSEEGLLEALGMISAEWSRDGFLHQLVAFASLGD